ncbi:MAG: extensin family protein [Alphaproteobacteria bacterium]|nr:extensin family protein [Alphaproteobacteria bacterium]
MDIRGFRTAKGNKTQLIAHWGPTQRDIAASKLAAAQRKTKTAGAARAAAASAAGNRGTAAASLATEASEPDQQPEAAAAKVEVAATESGPAVPDSGSVSPPRLLFRPSFLDSLGGARTAFGIAPSRLGGPALSALEAGEAAEAPSWPVLLVSDRIDISKASTPSARFLHEAHRTACRIFGTVLGPEANRAHRNHFHVDLAQRDLGNYCR